MRTISQFLVYAAFLLGGCATPIPLNTLKFERPAKVSSIKEATVVVMSGTVGGETGSYLFWNGRRYVSVPARPNSKFEFNSDDQQAFGESLRTELVRTGVLKAAGVDAATARDLKIQIIFEQTYHCSFQHDYVLNVVVHMTGGKEPLLRKYRIVSSEKDSTWEKWNTNPYEGKAKAARLLLEKVIPDIELYVATL